MAFELNPKALVDHVNDSFNDIEWLLERNITQREGLCVVFALPQVFEKMFARTKLPPPYVKVTAIRTQSTTKIKWKDFLTITALLSECISVLSERERAETLSKLSALLS